MVNFVSKWYVIHNANRSSRDRGPVCVGGEVPRNLIKGPPQSRETLWGKEQRRSGRDGADAVSSGASMFKDPNRFSSFFAVFLAFSRIVVCIPQMDLVSAFGALIRI